MVFSYYKKLSAANSRVYCVSAAIDAVDVPRVLELQPLIPELAHALEQEDRLKIEELCRKLAEGLADRMDVPALRVRVLAVRPSASRGELHGLYQPIEGRVHAVIML